MPRKKDIFALGRMASGHLPLAHTHAQADKANARQLYSSIFEYKLNVLLLLIMCYMGFLCVPRIYKTVVFYFRLTQQAHELA